MIAEFGRKRVISAMAVLVLAAQPFILSQALDGGQAWLDAVIWGLSVGLVGVGCRLLFGQRAAAWSLAFVAGWLITTVGVVPSLVTVLWFVSALCWGSVFLQMCRVNPRFEPSAIEATLLGAAWLMALWGGMLHFPVNYASVYVATLVAPVICVAASPSRGARPLRRAARDGGDWLRSIPYWVWIAGLALVGWTLRWSAFPSVGFDDNVYHLRLWTELLTTQKAQFAVDQQVWSVAPFATDLLHAGLSVMSGADARGAINLALAVLLLALMQQILRKIPVAPPIQWLLMVLMASTPLAGAALLTLQTELPLAVVGLAGIRLAMATHFGLRARNLLGVLAACALCLAIKLTGLVLAVMILAYLGLRWLDPQLRREAPAPYLHGAAWIALVPLAFVALHSYGLAWILTGNPVFPLYNAVFRSPLFPPFNFSDERWAQGFSLASYVRVFFQTSKFFESADYAAGWQYLVLVPVSMLALLRPGVPKDLRMIAIPVLGYAMIMFSAVQYWRYLFPVMPLACVFVAALFVGGHRLMQAGAAVLTVACIVLNYAQFTNISWIMGTPASAAATKDMREGLMRRYSPASQLTDRLNAMAPGARVLYPPALPWGATLHGTPLYVAWYAPERAARFSGVVSPESMGAFLSQERVEFAIGDMSTTRPAGTPETELRDYLAHHGMAILQVENLVLYRVNASALSYRNVFSLHSAGAQAGGQPDTEATPETAGVTASPQEKTLAAFETQGARQALFRVRYACPTDGGYLVAKISWDKGAPYYRLVDCTSTRVSFSEALPVPLGAQQGTLSIEMRDAQAAVIEDISVDLR